MNYLYFSNAVSLLGQQKYVSFFKYKKQLCRAVVTHTFNPSTWEAEAGGFWVRGQPGLQNEFQDSQGYTEKPCLEIR